MSKKQTSRWNTTQPNNNAAYKTDNLIRSINRTLKQFFDTFGGQSTEYIDMYTMATDLVKGNVYRKGVKFHQDKPTEPLQLARGKNATTDRQALLDLRSAQLNYGSANEVAQKYKGVLNDTGESFSKSNIKNIANVNYTVSNNQAEMYLFIMMNGDNEDCEKAHNIMVAMNTHKYKINEERELFLLHQEVKNKIDNNNTDDSYSDFDDSEGEFNNDDFIT